MKAKENPFRAERLHQLAYQFNQGTLDSFYTKVREADFRGAIVGPHGAGKTTLLEGIEDRLISDGHQVHHLRLHDDGRTANRKRVNQWLQTATDDLIWLLDSAGLLPWWKWKQVVKASRSTRGLIITSHRPGRLPTLIQCQPNSQLFIKLVLQLDSSSTFSDGELEMLFREYKGNMRDCFRVLYDRYAQW